MEKHLTSRRRIFEEPTPPGGYLGWGDIIKILLVLGDGALFSIPKGYMLGSLIVNEQNGGSVELNFGSAAGTSDVYQGLVVSPNSLQTITVNNTFALDAAQTIYVSDTGGGWGTAKVDVYGLIFKIK